MEGHRAKLPNKPHSASVTMQNRPEIQCRVEETDHPKTRKSDGEQLFSCGYRKSSTMTDPYPTGPVVYILRNGTSLYVGATIDLSHRIRQHNGELSGGAHRTSTKGPGWVCLLYVQGFQSRTESLQFEYALKREAKHHGYSTQARKRAVHALLSRVRLIVGPRDGRRRDSTVATSVHITHGPHTFWMPRHTGTLVALKHILGMT